MDTGMCPSRGHSLSQAPSRVLLLSQECPSGRLQPGSYFLMSSSLLNVHGFDAVEDGRPAALESAPPLAFVPSD